MLLDLLFELQSPSVAESAVLDNDVLTVCSAICQRAQSHLATPFPKDSAPQPQFLLFTWDEYHSQREAEALKLLHDRGILFGTRREMAYRNMKQSQNTKERRLFDLAGMLGKELDMALDLDSGPVIVLTEGSLHTSKAILDELR